MKRNVRDEAGVTFVTLIIIIVILVIIAGVTVYFLTRDNGIIKKTTNVELEYSKTEVSEKLDKEVNTKLLEAYNQIKDTTNDISTVYNENNLISYFDNSETDENLVGIDCIDPDTNSSKVLNAMSDGEVYEVYYIKPKVLSSEITMYGLGKDMETGDVFTLEVVKITREDGTVASSGEYDIKYYDNNGKGEVIGRIVLYKNNKS